MIHPPDTHQSIDAYIIHVTAITDHQIHIMQYMIIESKDTDSVYLSSSYSIRVNSIVNITLSNIYCHFHIVSYKKVISPQ